MAIKRIDKLETVNDVAREILKNPLQTNREIGAKIGKDHSTVSRAKKELQEIATKDLKLSDLLAGDIQIQLLAQHEMNRRLCETPHEVNGTDLKGFSEITLKRAQLLSGNATEREELIIKWDA